jgi:hypothetical protein
MYRSRAKVDPYGTDCGVSSVSAPHALFRGRLDLWTRRCLEISIVGGGKTGILDYSRLRDEGESKRFNPKNDGARVRDRLCERSVLIWEGRDYGNHEGE